jgi:murein tripeptide amidase MpaA
MYKKRSFYTWLFIGTLVISLIPGAAQTSESGDPPDSFNTRKIVKIQVGSQDEINELANIVEPWEVHEDYIITDITERVLQQIMDKGFSVEVLFESSEEFITFYGRSLPRAGPEGLYHSYSEIKDELQQLASAYPQIAKVYDIGDSWEKTRGIANRDILAIKISDNVGQEEDEPEILFIGCHHAREWISVEVPFYLAKYLVENYGTDPVIRSYVDNGEIWIVPMLNPDGHQYSIDGDRWWRKNRRNNGGGSYGVDLNRNYSYMWGGPGSSSDPWSDIYRGTAPFSEPETRAIRDLALSHEFRAIMNYHSYGQLILYPWGYTQVPPPDEQLLSNLSLDMANLIHEVHGEVYVPMQSSSQYVTSGTTNDWAYGELGTISFTVELRPQGFPYFFMLPEEEIIPTWEENKPAALYLINWTQLPEILSPDIKANGSDGPLSIPQGTYLNVTIALDLGSYAGVDADWWVMGVAPFGRYWYTLGRGWVRSDDPIRVYGGSLFNLSPYDVLNNTGLPRGKYTFYFGVDLVMNGSLDLGQLYYDTVDVEIE